MEEEDEANAIVACTKCGTNVTDKFCTHCGTPAPAPDDLRMPFSGLSLVCKDMRDVFRECMSNEVKARVQEMQTRYERLKHELEGYMHLVPAQTPVTPQTLTDKYWHKITNPHPEQVCLHMTVRCHLAPGSGYGSAWNSVEHGSFIDTWFRMSFKKDREQWKLWNVGMWDQDNLEITIKRCEEDEWNKVLLHPGLFPPPPAIASTTFYDGDQVNVRRWVASSGRFDPISFDGTEATNCFPVTIRII